MTVPDDHSQDRPDRRTRHLWAPVAAGAAALGLCCGLPLLASLGAAGVIAGLGLGSWLAVGAAVVVVAIGVMRWRHRSRCAIAAEVTGPAGSMPASAPASVPLRGVRR